MINKIIGILVYALAIALIVLSLVGVGYLISYIVTGIVFLWQRRM